VKLINILLLNFTSSEVGRHITTTGARKINVYVIKNARYALREVSEVGAHAYDCLPGEQSSVFILIISSTGESGNAMTSVSLEHQKY
jgi:hypothetical protein